MLLKVVIAAFLAVAGLQVAACGGGDTGSSRTQTPSVQATSVAATTTMADEASDTGTSFTPEASYTAKTKKSDGSTATMVIDRGKLTRAADGVPAEFAEFPGICEANAQRDAVMPLRLAVTNTTEGFSSQISVGLLVSGFDGVAVGNFLVDIATSFSDGGKCASGPAGVVQQYVDFGDVAPGATAVHDFVVVFHNYYSPDAPAGEKAALSELRANLLTGSGLASDTICFSGPGRLNAQFPLDGSTIAGSPGSRLPDC